MHQHCREDDFIEDYCDGESYKRHPLFSECTRALEIIFYYEDVEIVNPIGSRTKIHKLGNTFC